VTKPTICILAAGKGTRLGIETADLPKSLLTIGKDTILDRQFSALRDAGIANHDVCIVTGHAASRLRERVNNSIRLIYNEHYHDYNNIYTVHLLADHVNDDMILINGDTIFHEDILRDLFASTDDASLVIDTTKHLGDEEMKTHYVDGRLRRIGKEIDPAEATGEYIGLLRLRGPALQTYFAAISDMIGEGLVHEWYEAGLNRITDDVRIGMVPTQGRPWIEIDTPDDVRLAQQIAQSIADSE
jgi:L-glutamine-phosphate cytidylyltransferase